MKNIKVLLMLCIASLAAAQASIGGKQSVEGTATILDFNNTTGNTNGIILSAVDNTTAALASTTTNNNGTFLFDKSDNKVKMYEKNTWVALTDAGNASGITANISAETGNGTIIGASSTPAKGVLVLESADKAMILPRIANPHINVKSPYPGMICYDTVSKSLAVFDGASWSYWK